MKNCRFTQYLFEQPLELKSGRQTDEKKAEMIIGADGAEHEGREPKARWGERGNAVGMI